MFTKVIATLERIAIVAEVFSGENAYGVELLRNLCAEALANGAHNSKDVADLSVHHNCCCEIAMNTRRLLYPELLRGVRRSAGNGVQYQHQKSMHQEERAGPVR